MKRAFLLFNALLLITLMNVEAQTGTVCRPGFTYSVSQSANWGTNLPVVTSVAPYTSAEAAGLKHADIILKINGVSTTKLTAEEITQQLNLAGKKQTALEVQNVAHPKRTLFLNRDCKPAASVTESQLATAFEMYGLDYTHTRTFVCPFTITAAAQADYARFKTFSFAPTDQSNAKVETVINSSIEKELTQKGLIRVDSLADILVQTFYHFDKNPDYMGQNRISTGIRTVDRYNSITGKFEAYPFLRISASTTEAAYLLELGIRLIDQTDPLPETPTILWECEAKEKLTDPFSLETYARSFVPLMCMQYPFVRDTKNVRFKASYKAYNYTGIGLDKDSLCQVVEVDKNSPAYAAGIRAKDRILKINKQDAVLSIDQLSAAYRAFILDSFKYRDPQTRFTSAANVRSCMFWDKDYYAEVADMIHAPKYHALFAYLYNFAPYINPTGINTCEFVIERRGEEMEMLIRPIIRPEFTLSIEQQ